MKGSSCPHNHLTCMHRHEFPSVQTALNGLTVPTAAVPTTPLLWPSKFNDQEYAARPLHPPLYPHPPQCVSHPQHRPHCLFVIVLGHGVLCLEWLECCR